MTGNAASPCDAFNTYFSVDFASSAELRKRVFEVRYRVYCEEFGYEERAAFPDGQERDKRRGHSCDQEWNRRKNGGEGHHDHVGKVPTVARPIDKASCGDRTKRDARQHGDILYAVPGSPLVLERTVRLLQQRCPLEGIALDIRPAMSFLDVAWARLAIDPIETSVRLIDGHDFVSAAADETGPLLVAHTHANWVLSDIKLAAEHATGDESVSVGRRDPASSTRSIALSGRKRSLT